MTVHVRVLGNLSRLPFYTVLTMNGCYLLSCKVYNFNAKILNIKWKCWQKLWPDKRKTKPLCLRRAAQWVIISAIKIFHSQWKGLATERHHKLCWIFLTDISLVCVFLKTQINHYLWKVLFSLKLSTFKTGSMLFGNASHSVMWVKMMEA